MSRLSGDRQATAHDCDRRHGETPGALGPPGPVFVGRLDRDEGRNAVLDWACGQGRRLSLAPLSPAA